MKAVGVIYIDTNLCVTNKNGQFVSMYMNPTDYTLSLLHKLSLYWYGKCEMWAVKWQLWLDRYRVLKLGVCLRCILNCRADVKSMLSKCTWWESTWINYLTAIFVERGNKQTAASLQSDTHGAWNSIPLIWVAHIYVRCCLFQTHNWGRICHLSHQIEPVLYCISAASGF